MALTPKQAVFVQEYLVDLNATQAYIRAGYAPDHAEVSACQLLRNPKVSAAVQEAMDARAARTAITADRVMHELAKLGFANMMDYMTIPESGDAFVDLSKLTRDQAAALSEVTVEGFVDGRGEDARDVKRVKIKLADKRAALVDLGRNLKMFTDKTEVSGPNGGPIQSVGIKTDDPAEAAKVYQQLINGT